MNNNDIVGKNEQENFYKNVKNIANILFSKYLYEIKKEDIIKVYIEYQKLGYTREEINFGILAYKKLISNL